MGIDHLELRSIDTDRRARRPNRGDGHDRDPDEIEREAKETRRQGALGTLPDHAAVQILAALVEELPRDVARLRREVRVPRRG